MDKYIPDHLRKSCYFDWVKVRRCASNHIGDAFAMHLNVSRSLEDDSNTEEEQIRTYEKLMQDKFNLIKKELKIAPEEGEGEEGEEEAEETAEESSEEAAEEAGEEPKSEEAAEGSSEEAAESKTEEGSENKAEDAAEVKTEAIEESSDNAIEA